MELKTLEQVKSKKPYVTDEQYTRCVLLDLIIYKPWSKANEPMPFTATKGGKFICKVDSSPRYDSVNKNDYQFFSPQEIIDFVSSGKYFLGHEVSDPTWSWTRALSEFNSHGE